MKLLHSHQWRHCFSSRVLGALLYSTKTPKFSAPQVDTLHGRISRAGNPSVPITGLLDQWVEEGRDVKQSELQKFIKLLRNYRRYTHALQVSEWMSNERNHDLSSADIAIRLDLISKVHGLEQAEKYFESVPHSLRVNKVYGALLNCYASHKCLEKAEAIMKKMRDLGFINTSLSYNVMLNLYSQMGKHEKLDVLMQDMENSGINPDNFTYNTRMNAYAASSDIANMEKLLMKMEADPLITTDWHAYYVAANGYFKFGLFEKSKTMLKRSEQLIHGNETSFAYECLLTLHTAIGNKDEVYRIWNLYKNLRRKHNSGYLCMISSLRKFDDIDGAENILKEWESAHTCFDFRIPNVLIGFYCKKGNLEKAEAFVNELIKSGKEPPASTWQLLANGYQLNNELTKAAETMKKAIMASQPGWKPHSYTLTACLEYLKARGDLEEAEEIIRLTKEHGLLSSDVYYRLINYIHSEDQSQVPLIRESTTVR